MQWLWCPGERETTRHARAGEKVGRLSLYYFSYEVNTWTFLHVTSHVKIWRFLICCFTHLRWLSLALSVSLLTFSESWNFLLFLVLLDFVSFFIDFILNGNTLDSAVLLSFKVLNGKNSSSGADHADQVEQVHIKQIMQEIMQERCRSSRTSYFWSYEWQNQFKDADHIFKQ